MILFVPWEYVDAVFDSLIQLIAKLVCHLGKPGRIIIECNLGNQKGILSADRKFFIFLKSYSLESARLLLLIRTMALCRDSAVTWLPVISSTTPRKIRISSAHALMSFSRFICGRSMTWTGTSSARISHAFFFPSQVVSPTYISAILKNGQVRSSLAPTDALISGQVLVGSTFSPPGTQNWEPPHSPVAIASAANTISSGT